MVTVNTFVPLGFAHPRPRALTLGCCARCGRDVNPAALPLIDAREYRISALCPDCFEAIAAMFEQEGD